MTLSPYLVALHWPFVRSHLLVRERRSRRLEVLELLAVAQHEAAGEPVSLAWHLAGAGWSAGELGRARMALRELEAAGVATRHGGGSGRRPALWSLTADVGGRWRVAWRSSAAVVEEAVGACACRSRAVFPVAARMAGQAPALPREWGARVPQFHLPPSAHLDFSPVETRGYEKHRAATRNFPERMGQSRAATRSEVGASLLAVSSFGTNPHEQEEELLEHPATAAVAMLMLEVCGAAPWPRSEPRRRLSRALEAGADPAVLAAQLRRLRPGSGGRPPLTAAVALAEDLARVPVPPTSSSSTGPLSEEARAEARAAAHRLAGEELELEAHEVEAHEARSPAAADLALAAEQLRRIRAERVS